jgi:hypothetical protein
MKPYYMFTFFAQWALCSKYCTSSKIWNRSSYIWMVLSLGKYRINAGQCAWLCRQPTCQWRDLTLKSGEPRPFRPVWSLVHNPHVPRWPWGLTDSRIERLNSLTGPVLDNLILLTQACVSGMGWRRKCRHGPWVHTSCGRTNPTGRAA